MEEITYGFSMDEIMAKEKFCHKSLEKYFTNETTKLPILFFPRNKKYANKLGIDLNNLDVFYKNTVTQDILINIGREWIEFIHKSNFPVYNKKTSVGFWNQLHFKINKNSQMMVKIMVIGENWKDFLFDNYFDVFIKELDSRYGTNHGAVYIQWSKSITCPNKDENIVLVYGKDGITENILDINFHITPYTFSQGNPFTCNMLYRNIHKFIDNFGTKPIICYGRNIGHICFTWQKQVKVYGFNPCPIVDKDLRITMLQNHIVPDISLILDIDCNKTADTLRITNNNNTIIVSPGRNGLKPNIISAIKISRTNIKEFYYVSCHVNSLVRDLESIGECKITKIQPIDLFPSTKFCEMIVKIVLS
ncbi:rna methyltransferase [Tupanvirus deep ocean]|uniref:Rna methyltransferase n=2 Tax=Tupanvirus TaxID=2094720 RepID=A0AC62A8A5_9VIRU|nr:rna methyltransferase [Tupanvirus deep ocean]QKU34010.1 rna methyltransferase [Tupanvirus deep ocean]